MRKILCLFVLLSGAAMAQTPSWYEDEMNRMVGTWVADNSAYSNEQETDDAYAIHWDWGAGQKSLLGELYGMKDKKKTNSYWQFFQFWDAKEKKARVIQVSPWGVKGEGFLQQEDSTHTRMQQVFVMPDGQTYESGHTTEIGDKMEITTSYNIREGEWVANRTYTWIKQ
jgi:hypothetical protein